MIIKARAARSVVSRTKGLIGESNIEPLFFQTRFGIHTFGMKKPIDVLILDQNKRVRTLREKLNPNRIFVWNPRFKQILELPNEFIQHNGIQVGDQIQLEFIE